MNFSSDNTAPVAPDILDAIVRANEGFAPGYGDDDWTRSVERRLSEIFEREVAAFLVPTGTAANALALAHVTPPWGVVLCHAESHIATDECGAPEFFGAGLKLAGLPGVGGKIAPPTLEAALAGYGGHSPHQSIASALSITQASEAGTVYRTGEIAALCAIAHRRALAVHMDGARFANAMVRLDVAPAQMTWRAGVDVLSLGVTKVGALAAEAVVFFDPPRAAFMAERRKRAGHLLSKHRFIAAQFAAVLAQDRWLALARHANAAADRLAGALAAIGLAYGRSRPISSSSHCRARSTRGSRPPGPATMCARAKASLSAPTKSWRDLLLLSRRRTMKSIGSLRYAKGPRAHEGQAIFCRVLN
jgi:threonine aldolase